MQIKVRKFRKEDTAQVLRLNRALHAMHGMKATITAQRFVSACLRDKLANCSVAVGEGRIAGFSSSHDWIDLGSAARTCTIDHFCIHEKYRGHGVALALMQHEAEAATRRGCSTVEVSAVRDNKRANAFYRKSGFSLRKRSTNDYVLQGQSLPQFVRRHSAETGRH
jgi:ribosomal protein S18 acetylase RimI-like enzyme